jgi:hypothetical protein
METMSPADLTRRCAWCGSVHGPAGWGGAAEADTEQTTHGICDCCFDRLERERMERTLAASARKAAA